jgi:hypothetical protein
MKITSKIWLRNQISSNWKALPDKVPFRSTFYDRVVGMAPDMIGPRWKRRPFVDEGIPADMAPEAAWHWT